jgi:hypothetical protein
MANAKAAAVPLYRIEFVVPFVATDFSLGVFLFVETDAQLHSSDAESWFSWLKREFLSVLRAKGYPDRWLGAVTFELDSHENVVKNFEGSYFYRLR